ncbi:MAG: sigma-70 family RNA polymerase sigma factor [Spirochaetaceae bacterium]|nr:sigma-70 family RNA polymerase sigma factor [Spirochaetaceae bacterium]
MSVQDGFASTIYYTGESDEAIVRQVVLGQKELFRFLIKRHENAVKGFGYSFFRNKEEISDFAQDVFLKAFNKLDQFKGNSRFSTWLYRISYTTAINKINRGKEYQSLADNDYISAYCTPEDQHIKDVIRCAVREAVKELPDKYRICIDLFFFYDRSYCEIEEITGIPVNTVKSNVFRAKKILREKLSSFAK